MHAWTIWSHSEDPHSQCWQCNHKWQADNQTHHLGQLIWGGKPCPVFQPYTATLRKGPPYTIQHGYLPGSCMRQQDARGWWQSAVDEVDEGDGIDELDKMSGVEQEWVLENTAEVHGTVTKVHQYTFTLTLVIHYWLLTNLTDSMAGIHNHPFNKNCAPYMVPYLLKIQLQKEAYPPWCGNLMELNLWHDAICTQIPTYYWWYHC